MLRTCASTKHELFDIDTSQMLFATALCRGHAKAVFVFQRFVVLLRTDDSAVPFAHRQLYTFALPQQELMNVMCTALLCQSLIHVCLFSFILIPLTC